MINPKLNLDADGAMAPLIYVDSKEKICVCQRPFCLKSLTHLETLHSGSICLSIDQHNYNGCDDKVHQFGAYFRRHFCLYATQRIARNLVIFNNCWSIPALGADSCNYST
jgi:hypothetical protein